MFSPRSLIIMISGLRLQVLDQLGLKVPFLLSNYTAALLQRTSEIALERSKHEM